MTATQDPFDDLLAWLDPDRDIAARKYETIRAGLIRIFVAKGFSDAEDLADEVITRVTRRLPEIRDDYVGEPARYFHGVARYLILEHYPRKEIALDALDMSPVSGTQPTGMSDEYECLMLCLEFLTSAKRELILDYHIYEGHDKIEQHEIMAEELGISKGALRLRTYHIRDDLEKCVLDCVENRKKKTKGVAGSILDSGAGTRSVHHGPGRRK